MYSWIIRLSYKEDDIELKCKDDADKVLQEIGDTYTVENIDKKAKNKKSKPPFITSTLQQEASTKLGFSAKKTMSIAQKLYEGIDLESETVGLISYMRTDSTRISEVARSAAKQHIEAEFGKEYYENRYYKTKKDSQDAHEAIRPTYIELTPDKIKADLTNDQYKLYKLIYNRFIASQMASAIYDTVGVKVLANNYVFRANGQTIKFKGFMALYVETEDNEENR